MSGRTYEAFLAERIFKPLGMTRTHFRQDHAEIIKGQAYGYVPARNTFRLSVTNFDTAGATKEYAFRRSCGDRGIIARPRSGDR